jgi:hypothetical protein
MNPSDDSKPTLGDLGNQQRYSSDDVARIARAARPFVTGAKDAGKVYCPFCKLREARWRRALDPARPRVVDLFVYCTQCHKTGVTMIDLDAKQSLGDRLSAWLSKIWGG